MHFQGDFEGWKTEKIAEWPTPSPRRDGYTHQEERDPTHMVHMDSQHQHVPTGHPPTLPPHSCYHWHPAENHTQPILCLPSCVSVPKTQKMTQWMTPLSRRHGHAQQEQREPTHMVHMDTQHQHVPRGHPPCLPPCSCYQWHLPEKCPRPTFVFFLAFLGCETAENDKMDEQMVKETWAHTAGGEGAHPYGPYGQPTPTCTHRTPTPSPSLQLLPVVPT